MHNTGKPWSDADIAACSRHYPDTDNATLARIFRRTESSIQNLAIKRGWRKSAAYMAGKPGCFKPGLVPWNKGKPHPTRGRAAETQFRKGQRPHTWVPIGHERVSKEGILERKVQDSDHPKDNFRSVHSIIWEERHGPIPEGYIVRFKSGDKRNFDDDNLELVSRADHMRRNSIHRYGPEIAQLYQLKGALSRKINRRSRDIENQDHRSA